MTTPQQNAIQRVALYARVSTEDQADRGTIDAQRRFLRDYARLYGMEVAGEYVDDGWSGTIPLRERPDGLRLLEDARSGRFQVVVIYRLDRLSRSLAALLDAHTELERTGVTIRSGTEPFDTSNPMGRFLFQLLGSMAELEKSTILERVTRGRDRIARQGYWTNGSVPFGYDLTRDGTNGEGTKQRSGRLVPSGRIVPGLGITEAELVRDIFRRVAAGSTAMAEAKRLQALGVPRTTLHRGGAVVVNDNPWEPTRICKMLRKPVYMGVMTLDSRNEPGKPITAEVPALVDRDTFERAGMQLSQNKKLSKRNATRTYLLRGLIRCATCGRGFTGSVRYSNGKGFYYRCNGALYHVKLRPAERCKARNIPGEWLDDLVWRDCRTFILNPGEALAEAREQLRERMARTASVETEVAQLRSQLRAKEAERERVMTMFRRGRITVPDMDAQLDSLNAEASQIRSALEALESQTRLADAYEARFSEVSALLQALRTGLEEIERTNDIEAKRRVVEMLVAEILVTTTGAGKDKVAALRVSYTFAPRREETTAPARTSHASCSRDERRSGLYFSIPGTES